MSYDASNEIREMSVEDKVKLIDVIYSAEPGDLFSERTKQYILGGCALPSSKMELAVSEKAFQKLNKLKSRWVVNGKVFLFSSDRPKGFVIEHMIPVKVLHNHLKKNYLARGGLSREDLNNFVKKYCKVVLITEEEDKSLREAKLTSKMPKDCDFTKDPTARYKECGITLHKSSK